MIFSFLTFEFSFQLFAGGSLESADVVGEEDVLMVWGGVIMAAATRGTNTGAVGHSDTALLGDPLGVAGDNAVEVGGMHGPEFLVGAIFRPWLVLSLSKNWKGLPIIP